MTDKLSDHRIFRHLADPVDVVQPNTCSPRHRWQRAQWRSLLKWLSMLIVAMSLVIVFLLAVQYVMRWENVLTRQIQALGQHLLPPMDAADIFVLGNHQISRQEVLQTLSIPEDHNVYTLDFDALHGRLLNHAWVESVHLWRFWDNLWVTLTEKTPVAIEIAADQILSGNVQPDAYFLLDHRGKRIMPVSATEALKYPDFPRLRGRLDAPSVRRLMMTMAQYPTLRDYFIGADRMALQAWRLWFKRVNGAPYFVVVNDSVVMSFERNKEKDIINQGAIISAPSDVNGEQNDIAADLLTGEANVQGLSGYLALLKQLEKQYRFSQRAVLGFDMREYPRILITKGKNKNVAVE